MWVSWVSGAEGVSLSDESFSRVREVGDVVGDVSFGDEMSGRGKEDLAELDLTGTAGGGLAQLGEGPLCFPGERDPVRLSDVGEGCMGGSTTVVEKHPLRLMMIVGRWS